jgi:hypothetical protein
MLSSFSRLENWQPQRVTYFAQGNNSELMIKRTPTFCLEKCFTSFTNAISNLPTLACFLLTWVKYRILVLISENSPSFCAVLLLIKLIVFVRKKQFPATLWRFHKSMKYLDSRQINRKRKSTQICLHVWWYHREENTQNPSEI